MLEEVRNIVNEVFEKEMSNLMANINKTITLTVSTCLKSIDSKIEELQRSVSFISSQYDDIKKEIDKYSDIFEKQRLENESLQSTVTDLTNKINLMEQQARSNNIEIQCVPEAKNENLISITKQLSKTVGYDITESNISHCTRIAKMNPKSTRPRSIIVQLNSPLVRDHLLAAEIKFNKGHTTEKLNASHLGIQGAKCPVYVCEHLSTSNKLLHGAARRKATELNYKYVWVRSGKIFMRKTDNSDYKVITNMNYLSQLT
ncbi:uncharacterized protein LOC126979120 [Leptidea sinapis]|uniref:uncharacterized protein LOC126979120 n=1 Tax=Leptidea sinapis TaxID=189913 RepID=UPI0021C259D6|nr:uncharacterized protein LOC126979120 [Leptidea sinapis]